MTSVLEPGTVDDAATRLESLMTDLTTYRFVTDVLVTPSLARRILDLNAENNRNLKPTLVTRYARDMRKGLWQERTGQTLSIATDGTLTNGQHRMHAVIESGTPIRFDFAIGVAPRTVVVTDAGPARSGADIIKVSGGGDVSRCSPIVRWVWAWEQGSYRGTTGKVTPTPMEISQRYQLEPGLFEAAAARGLDASRKGLAAGSAVGTAYMLLSHIDTEVAFEFFDRFISGLGLNDGDAVKALRERLIRRRIDRTQADEQLALIIRAWNAYNTLKDGQRIWVERLQMTRQGELTNANFPKPKKAAK